jgi:diadenosine tetraphosphate (Ap4A) HIT family hydrolase
MPIQLPVLDPCSFCQIVDGSVEPWNVLERTSLTLTILNGRQFEVGQCVVIPARHAPTLLDLRPDEEAAVMAAARRLARALIAAFDPDGVLLYQNNGVGSGQEVPHFHLHVVPRRPGSDWGLGPPHLARLEHPAAHLDYRVITDGKRHTAEVIRRSF